MIDHISLPVRDLATAARFYAVVLAPLGYVQLVERPHTVGFGKTYPEFWLNHRPELTLDPDTGVHVALRASNEEAVRAFHAAALELGAVSDGAPGPRAAAQTTYYGAFIRDPDGNRVEAVSFG